MAEGGKREFHPALLMYSLTLLLLALTILLGFIALFVPWAMQDVAPGQRVWAYPFKSCIVQTFSKVNLYSCEDNDFINPLGMPLTGGNATCKALVIVAIAMGFVAIIIAFLVWFPLLTVFLKLWYRPLKLAVGCQVFIVLVPCCTVCCWGLFIGFAENKCAPLPLWPVKGYSYGFILFLFCTALSTAACVTGFLGLKKLKNYRPLQLDEQEKAMYPVPYQVFYEYPPQAAPTPVPIQYYAPVALQ